MPYFRSRFKAGQQVQADAQEESGVAYVNGKPVPYDIGDYLVTDKHGFTYVYPKRMFDEGYVLET